MHPRFRPLCTLFLLILPGLTLAFAQKPELVVQTGHSGRARPIAISPDGKLLASAGAGIYKSVKLWDIETGRELRTLKGHSFPVQDGAFSVDGEVLATASTIDEIPNTRFVTTIKLWNVSTGVELETIKAQGIGSLAVSPHGQILAAVGEGTIRLWDTARRTELKPLTANPTSNLAFSPDGTMLAGGSETTIELWNVATGKQVGSLRGHSKNVQSVVFSADGKTLASTGEERTVKLWELSSGQELQSLQLPDVDQAVAEGLRGGTSGYLVFSPAGQVKVIAEIPTEDDKGMKLFDLTSNREIQVFKSRADAIETLVFNEAQGILALGSNDRTTIKRLELPKGQVQTFTGAPFEPVPGILNKIIISPDGKTLAGTAFGKFDGTFSLKDIRTGTEQVLKGSNSTFPLVFSPNGKLLVTEGDGKITLWDVSTRQKRRTFATDNNLDPEVNFSSDSQTVAVINNDSINVFDVTTGREKWRSRRSGSVIALSADGRMLASLENERWAGPASLVPVFVIKVWNLRTGRLLQRIKSPAGPDWSLAFSPDGKQLAVGSWDGVIRLLDIATGKVAQTFKGHSDGVTYVTFVSDGRMLLSGSSDGTVKLWEPATGTELLSLIAVEQQDYLAVTPEGLFDGSPAAWKQILWRFSSQLYNVLPVEAFYNDFYHPGLVEEIMSGKRPPAPKDISQKDRRQIPLRLSTADKIEPGAPVASRTVAVQVEVEEAPAGQALSDKSQPLPPSGARDVRLFRNGSLVKLWKGDLFTLSETDGCQVQPQASPQSPRRSICTATVPIVAGTNRFTAYAFNNDNVKSLDADLTPITGDQSLQRPATLYVLAIGVGQNANPAFTLDYAVKDAQDFGEQTRLQQQRIGRYARSEVITLLDEQATKENILAALRRLAALVHPEDGLIIYFSGHGTAQDKRFYMLPYDLGYQGPRTREAITKGSNLSEILSHSISDQDLEEVLRKADADQIVLVIDACNSGQALNADDPRRGPMNSTGLAQLAYEKGMYILTASQDWEVAYESKALGHSYLASALLEGLMTPAADENRDEKVVLREWFDYAVQRVPRMRQEKVEQTAQQQGSKALELVEVAEQGKVQTPRVFYRREPDVQPLVVAKTGAVNQSR